MGQLLTSSEKLIKEPNTVRELLSSLRFFITYYKLPDLEAFVTFPFSNGKIVCIKSFLYHYIFTLSEKASKTDGLR